MAPDQALICAGFGFRAAGPLEDFERALARALAAAGRTRAEVACISAPGFKPARLTPWAEAAGYRVLQLSLEELQQEPLPTLTQSPHVQAHYGLGSIAEACALVGALRLAPGRRVRLLGARENAGSASCALAISEQPP